MPTIATDVADQQIGSGGTVNTQLSGAVGAAHAQDGQLLAQAGTIVMDAGVKVANYLEKQQKDEEKTNSYVAYQEFQRTMQKDDVEAANNIDKLGGGFGTGFTEQRVKTRDEKFNEFLQTQPESQHDTLKKQHAVNLTTSQGAYISAEETQRKAYAGKLVNDASDESRLKIIENPSTMDSQISDVKNKIYALPISDQEKEAKFKEARSSIINQNAAEEAYRKNGENAKAPFLSGSNAGNLGLSSVSMTLSPGADASTVTKDGHVGIAAVSPELAQQVIPELRGLDRDAQIKWMQANPERTDAAGKQAFGVFMSRYQSATGNVNFNAAYLAYRYGRDAGDNLSENLKGDVSKLPKEQQDFLKSVQENFGRSIAAPKMQDAIKEGAKGRVDMASGKGSGAAAGVTISAPGLTRGTPTGYGTKANTYNGPLNRADNPSAPAPAQLYQFLLQKGATPNEALMLTSAAASESSFNPNTPHDNGTGWGMWGHRNERRAAMFMATGTNRPNWQQQAAFALSEIKGMPDVRMAAANAKTAEDLTIAQMHYERPQGYSQKNPHAGDNFVGRYKNTARFAELQGDGPMSAPVPVESGKFDATVNTPKFSPAELSMTQGGMTLSKLPQDPGEFRKPLPGETANDYMANRARHDQVRMGILKSRDQAQTSAVDELLKKRDATIGQKRDELMNGLWSGAYTDADVKKAIDSGLLQSHSHIAQAINEMSGYRTAFDSAAKARAEESANAQKALVEGLTAAAMGGKMDPETKATAVDRARALADAGKIGWDDYDKVSQAHEKYQKRQSTGAFAAERVQRGGSFNPDSKDHKDVVNNAYKYGMEKYADSPERDKASAAIAGNIIAKTGMIPSDYADEVAGQVKSGQVGVLEGLYQAQVNTGRAIMWPGKIAPEDAAGKLDDNAGTMLHVYTSMRARGMDVDTAQQRIKNMLDPERQKQIDQDLKSGSLKDQIEKIQSSSANSIASDMMGHWVFSANVGHNTGNPMLDGQTSASLKYDYVQSVKSYVRMGLDVSAAKQQASEDLRGKYGPTSLSSAGGLVRGNAIVAYPPETVYHSVFPNENSLIDKSRAIANAVNETIKGADGRLRIDNMIMVPDKSSDFGVGSDPSKMKYHVYQIKDGKMKYISQWQMDDSARNLMRNYNSKSSANQTQAVQDTIAANGGILF